MAVGVPETEVFAAADRVLARGERPTVERVRAELGRGSPARVGQLLDTWWEALAQRLAGETRLPALPAEVAQAFKTVWNFAAAQGQAVADAAITEAQASLTQQRTALAEAAGRQQAEMAAAFAAREEAERLRLAAEGHLADLQDLVRQTAGQNLDLTQQRDTLQRQHDVAVEFVAALRRQLSEREAASAAARDQHDAHVRAVENRAHAEVDRAREETKGLRTQLGRLEHDRVEFERRATKQRDETLTALRAAEREAASATARAQALEQQLIRLGHPKAAGVRKAKAPQQTSTPPPPRRSTPGKRATPKEK